MLIKILLFLSFYTPAYSNESEFNAYISKYEQLIKIQEKNFEKLKFTISENQIKRSAGYKLTLKDQLGREWLWKSGLFSSMDGAVAIYRLALMLDLPTPEIHYKELTINGEKVKGSLQLIHPAINELLPYNQLNEKSIQYYAKNHALSWLTLNHHVHPGQFIFLKNQLNGLQFLRIDNSVNWFLLGFDKLDTSFSTPLLKYTVDTGYFNFWNEYFRTEVIKKGIETNTAPKLFKIPFLNRSIQNSRFNLDLSKLYNWVLIFKSIPDSYYRNFYSEIIKNDFQFSANGSEASPWFLASEYVLQADKKNFLTNIVNRKNTADIDFKNFYSYVAKARGETFTPTAFQLKNELKSLEESLMIKMAESNELNSKLAAEVTSSQKEILTEISPSTHDIIFYLYFISFTQDPKGRLDILDYVISGLQKKLEDKKTLVDIEKEPLQIAIHNIKGLKFVFQKTNPPSYYVRKILNYHLIFDKNFYEDKK